MFQQEVDMIIAPIGVTGAREKVVDFTFAFFYDDSAVIMKKPDPEKNKWRTYIDIFKQEVYWEDLLLVKLDCLKLTILMQNKLKIT